MEICYEEYAYDDNRRGGARGGSRPGICARRERTPQCARCGLPAIGGAARKGGPKVQWFEELDSADAGRASTGQGKARCNGSSTREGEASSNRSSTGESEASSDRSSSGKGEARSNYAGARFQA